MCLSGQLYLQVDLGEQAVCTFLDFFLQHVFAGAQLKTVVKTWLPPLGHMSKM